MSIKEELRMWNSSPCSACGAVGNIKYMLSGTSEAVPGTGGPPLLVLLGQVGRYRRTSKMGHW